MTNGVIPLPDRRVQQAGRRLGDAQFIGVRKVSK
jgi:hypothetical protein